MNDQILSRINTNVLYFFPNLIVYVIIIFLSFLPWSLSILEIIYRYGTHFFQNRGIASPITRKKYIDVPDDFISETKISLNFLSRGNNIFNSDLIKAENSEILKMNFPNSLDVSWQFLVFGVALFTVMFSLGHPISVRYIRPMVPLISLLFAIMLVRYKNLNLSISIFLIIKLSLIMFLITRLSVVFSITS